MFILLFCLVENVRKCFESLKLSPAVGFGLNNVTAVREKSMFTRSEFSRLNINVHVTWKPR